MLKSSFRVRYFSRSFSKGTMSRFWEIFVGRRDYNYIMFQLRSNDIIRELSRQLGQYFT